MFDEYEKKEEMSLPYSKALSQYSHEGSKQNHEHSQSGHAVCRMRFQPETSRI
jgi:hypothetical protein